MSRAETELESARSAFFGHVQTCENGCRGFDHSAKAMTGLCYTGTQKYLALLDAEKSYITAIYKVPLAGKPETLRQRALSNALGMSRRNDLI